jgi:diadenosine tetraphosphate (Ap4A) HIT family hydrolase
MECDYCGDLEKYNFGDFLYQTPFWIVFLAPNQSNLGTCVIALKRKDRFLNGLSKEEWADFTKIVDGLEFALKESFDATLFNWGSLMNSFYLDGTPEPHLHWHFIPRYDHEVEIHGEIFDDPFFGYMRPRPPQEISKEVRENIRNSILDNLKKSI